MAFMQCPLHTDEHSVKTLIFTIYTETVKINVLTKAVDIF